MTTTQEVADAVLKTLFEGEGAHEQMRDFNPTLKLFESTKDEIEGGSTIKFPLQKQFQQGLGARANSQDLPTPGASNYIGCNFPLMKLCFSVQIETAAWKKTKNKGVASFVDLLSEQGTDVMGGFYRDMNWQLYNDGSGLRTTTNAGATITAPQQNVVLPVVSTKGLFEGMLIDIYAAGAANPSEVGLYVSAVDSLNSQITIQTITVPILDLSEVYRSGNKGNEIMGLKGFVNDTGGPASMQGITVASQVIWRGNVLSNSGTARPVSRNLMDLASKAGMGVTQRKPEVILMGLIQSRKYANITVIHEEYEKGKGEKITLDAGYERLLYKSIPIIEDPDCDDDRMYFLQVKNYLKTWHLGKPEFVYSPDAKHMWYRLEGKPFFRADGEYFVQFGGYRRNNQTILKDLDPAG